MNVGQFYIVLTATFVVVSKDLQNVVISINTNKSWNNLILRF